MVEMPTGRGIRLVQFLADVVDAFGDQIACELALRLGTENLLGCRDGCFGGRTTNVGSSLRFGLRDLGFGHLRAPGDKVLDPDLGLGGHTLGFGFRAGDDVLRLAFGSLAFALILGQQLRRFVLELASLVKFGLDARRAVVERLCDHPMHAEIAQQANEQDEGKGNPGFRLHQHGYEPFSAAATAAATVFSLGALPIRRSTIARVASSAMLRTLPMAACLVAAMVFSASASFVLSSLSRVFLRASASPACRSRVSVAITCARLRASAKAFSSAATEASDSPFRRDASARSSSMRFCRLSMIAPTRGSASLAMST